MDNQRDFFIKEKLQQDDLISKKAEDVFDNFFKGEIKMEKGNLNIDEKVVNINSAKDKKIRMKKMMSIVATLVIVFLGVNGYAATQGYNNIFFIIRNLVAPETIDGKDKILSDRDITISYQPIKISKYLNVQINKLIVKDNEATLYIDVTNNSNKNKIDNYVVYDITDGRKELIGNQTATNKKEARYVEKIRLVNFFNDTKILQLEMFDENHNTISVLEIDLDKKEINILTTEEKAIEKISEVELKEFLSNIVRFNFYKDKDSITKYHTEQEYKDEMKVLYALELLDKEKANFEEVHKVMKEFTGKNIENPLSLANISVTKTEKGYKYVIGKDSTQVKALCLQILDIKYSDEVYTASCVYTYITNNDYENNTIEKLDKFETTIEFTLNENYEYVKYCLLNADEFTGKPYEYYSDTNIETENNNNKTEINNTTISNTITNNSTTNNNSTINNNNRTNNTSTNIIPNSNNAVQIKPNDSWNGDNGDVPGNTGDSSVSRIWKNFVIPGLKGIVPVEWSVKEFITTYKGQEDDGKLAQSVSGIISGTDTSKNKEVKSNVIINFYMPEFIDVTSTEDYSRIVANRYNMEASWAGYTSPEGMDWKMVIKENNHRQFYCHLEPLSGNTEGIGYVIEIICDNYDNDELITVLYEMFMNLKGTSF